MITAAANVIFFLVFGFVTLSKPVIDTSLVNSENRVLGHNQNYSDTAEASHRKSSLPKP